MNNLLIILLPAFTVALVVLLTHIPLGEAVLKRGIIFIDLAIAQFAGLGCLLAQIWHIESHLLTQILALTFAIAGAIFFAYTERYSHKQEAIIGLSYVFITSVTILITSHISTGSEHLQKLLSGDLLFVSWDKIFLHLPIYLSILFLWFRKPQCRKGFSFYLIFSLAITSSVQLVGVLMVFVSLIAPALILEKYSLKIKYLVVFIAIVCGLLLSMLTDSPSSILCILSLVLIPLVSRVVIKPPIKS